MKKRLASLFLALALCLSVPAFAAEPADEIDPSLKLIAELIADWDGSYELPNLDALSPEDRETVKALADAILLAREAEPETQPETQDEAAPGISFTDVPATHTFYKGVMYCAGKGVVNGYADGTFQPAKTITNGHFCAMLARAFYPDQISKYETDYIKQTYGAFGPSMQALLGNRILNNTSLGKEYTNPALLSASINRYDMAQMMTSIMSKKGFAADASQKSAVQAQIADYSSIPGQYQDAVKNVYALGIITGYSDGSFSGTNIMNRGQAAIVIQRMAQYAPVTGGEHNQLDGGTEQKPESKPVESTPEPTPEEPAALTLRDGSAPTPENALKIIDEILQVYPSGTPWGEGNDGRRDSNVKIGGRELGGISSAVHQVERKHGASMVTACGGFAGLVSDAIFGGNTNGGNNFPMRQLDSVSQVRPGDIIVKLDANGYTQHISTAASSVNKTDTVDGVTRYFIDVYDGNNNGKVVYNNYGVRYLTDELFRGNCYAVYTRYPD